MESVLTWLLIASVIGWLGNKLTSQRRGRSRRRPHRHCF